MKKISMSCMFCGKKFATEIRKSKTMGCYVASSVFCSGECRKKFDKAMKKDGKTK